LKALFGARRVLALEHLLHADHAGKELADQLARLGYDSNVLADDTTTTGRRLYAENRREVTTDALRALLVHEALAFGLASSETAFLAERTEAGKPVEGTVHVANALPAGWSDDFELAYGLSRAALLALAALGIPVPGCRPVWY
jgi:Ca-activated chloride channel family protein